MNYRPTPLKNNEGDGWIMNIKYSKLRGYFAERGIKLKDVAKVIDVTNSTISLKLNKEGYDFTVPEMQAICNYYGISSDEYFTG